MSSRRRESGQFVTEQPVESLQAVLVAGALPPLGWRLQLTGQRVPLARTHFSWCRRLSEGACSAAALAFLRQAC